MELEIVKKKENPLLDRTEVEVLAHHQGGPTPQRDEVREQVAAAVKAKKDQVVVDHLDTTFGKGVTRGYVKVYKSKKAAMEIEEKPIIARNRLDGKRKAPEPKAEEAPKAKENEEPPEAKGSEEPPEAKGSEEPPEAKDGEEAPDEQPPQEGGG